MSLSAYGVFPEGYRAPRGEELLAVVQAALDAAFGESLNYDADTPEGVVAAVVAAVVGDLSEGAVQRLADALDINNAAEGQLEKLCLLFGLGRSAATASQASLTPTLSAPTAFVPAGTRFGTIPSGNVYNVFEAVEDTPLTGAPGEVIVVRCTELGPVAAAANTIVNIIDAVPGLSAVTNALAAALGRSEQKDRELRLERLRLLQAGGRGPIGAIRAAAIRALPAGYFVGAVENNSSSAVTVDGVPLGPNSHCIVVYPAPTAGEAELLALAIAQTRPAGGKSEGDQLVTVFDPERNSNVDVRFQVAATKPVAVELTLNALEDGFSAGEVGAAATAAVEAYFANLLVGDDVLLLRLLRALADVPGLLAVGVRLSDNGGPFLAADVPVGEFTVAQLSATTVLP